MTVREMPSSHFYGTRARIIAQYPGIDKDDVHDPPYRTNPRHVSSNKRRPETPIQALMECAPGDEPELSKLELVAVGEALAEAIDALADRDRFIFDCLVIERMSLRALGRLMSLSKTHVHRERNRILAELRSALAGDPAIQDYLNR